MDKIAEYFDQDITIMTYHKSSLLSLSLPMLIFILEPPKIIKLISPIVKTIKNISFPVKCLSFFYLFFYLFTVQTAAKLTN